MTSIDDKAEILVKVTGKGFSMTIFGIRNDEGSWTCAVEHNEIELTEIAADIHASELGQLRTYEKSEFKYSFEEAFRKMELTDWFLCHPARLYPEFADTVLEAFEKRMEEYELEYPADSPMERFIRDDKLKAWKKKANRE